MASREGLVLDGFDLNSASTAATSAFQTAALALTPALYWRHNEPSGTTATDTSGNSRAGTYVSGITVNQTGLLTGDSDKAITGDGTANAKVTSTYNPFTGNITVCGWANATTLAAARNLFGGSATNGPLLQIQTNGVVTWWSDLAAATQTWAAGTWVAATTYFWALTWNNSTKVSELFLNGVSQGTKTSANAFNATPGNFGLATSSAGSGFLGTMDETLIFSSVLSSANITALYNAGAVASTVSAFTLQGYEVPPPAKRQEWAQGADTDGALLVRDPLFENREITLRLRVAQQTTMDLALAQIATLSKKLEEAEQQPDGLALVWTPAGSANSVTFYVLSGTVDGLPIELSGEDAGWFLRAPVITVKLQCKPYWYGAPVTFGAVSSATPFVLLTLAAVGGDAPAEGRLQITDAASQNRRYIEWGLQWHDYDAATSLLVDSDDMTVTGFSGAQTTRTGAYDPNASGNNVIRSILYASPTAVCATGNLGHVGTFRVKARVYASANGQYVRLSWQEGDGPYRANHYAVPVVTAGFSEVDLGLITIPPKQLGTQRWQGHIEAYTTGTAGTDTLDVDYLVLIPAGEGYGKVRAQASTQTGAVVGADQFEAISTGTALSARTAPAGGAWATSGATTDFTAQTGVLGAEVEQRAAVSDSGFGRFAVLGSTSYTDVQVQVQAVALATKTQVRQGVVARYVDASNYLLAYAEQGASGPGPKTYQLVIRKNVAGSATELYRSAAISSSAGTPVLTVALTANATGVASATITENGAVVGSTSINDSDLVTGGALQTGKPGFFDYQPTSTAVTRQYDEFYVSTPAAEPIALYSGKVAEIRYDGAIRQDSTGTYYGPAPAYRGSRFLVPAAGDKNRTSRVLVKAHRNDIEAAGTPNVTDNLTVQAIVTPRGIVVPF